MVPFFIYTLTKKNKSCVMNHLSNHQSYVTGLKKSGLHKGDMIDYIAGIFNNMATRNDCLAFCMRYISPKDPKQIVNEAEFRRMLRKSEDKAIRELYFLAQERYKHVSRYRDDKVDQFDKTLTQIEREKLDKKEMKKESFEDQEMSMSASDFDTGNTSTNVQQISNDLVSRLGDVATHLQDLVSNDQIELSQDHMDAIAKLEKYVKAGKSLSVNENDSREFFLPVLETLNSIKDNKTKLLILRAKMFIK